MANEASLTLIGNTTAPAQLRFTPSGHAVANVTVAHTPRRFDRSTNEWVDEETVFMDCTGWRETAENMAETLADKGMRVIVTGQLKSQSWEDKQTGQRRSKVFLLIEEIGPSLKWATAQVNRKNANGGIDPYASNQGSGWGQPQGQSQGQNQGSGWSQPNNHAAQQGSGWGQSQGQPAGQSQGPWAGGGGAQDEPPPF